MLAVAVDAQGRIGISGEGLAAVDALFVLRVNKIVAAAAGLGLSGREMRLADTLDVVGAVAVCTDRGKFDEPFLEERFSMHAPEIFLIGRFAVDVVLDDDTHVFVAGGTGERDVRPEDGGFGVVFRANIMLAVAVPALGDVLGPALKIGPAVDTVGIGKRIEVGTRPAIFTVADGRAIDGRDVFLMRDVSFDLGRDHRMAVCASEAFVDRGKKAFFVDSEFLADGGFDAVTGKAGSLSGRCFFLGGRKANP